MKNRLLLLLAFAGIFVLSSFSYGFNDKKQPRTITRTSLVVDGNEVKKTVILFDGTTSRDDVIHTCGFLAKENVQLTFDKLEIGKSFFGLVGKNRIRSAEGQIKLPDGSSQRFKAGGMTGFRFVKIQYSNTAATNSSQIEMIEIVD